jgi:hypothetical protein
VEIRDVASIACDSVVTSILYWDERLIVGLSNMEIKGYSILFWYEFVRHFHSMLY